jgi:NTE family protein
VLFQSLDDHGGDNGEFEHVIRYDDGINSDFVLASCSVPVNYDYTILSMEDKRTKLGSRDSGHESNNDAVVPGKSSVSSSYSSSHCASYSSSSSSSNSNLRFFWDGGLLANTPLRQTIIAYRQYWYRAKKDA